MEGKIKRKERIYFLRVPVDIVSEENVFEIIKEIVAKGENNGQIMFLTMEALFRARLDPVYYKCLYESTLILPTARGIIRGIYSLRRLKATRYNRFDFVISLLSFAEKNAYPVYFLGGKKEDLEQAEKNVNTSFPNLRVIGRHAGYISGELETKVITAIRKSRPVFLLVGRGVKGREMWVHRHRQELQSGIVVWVDNCIEIFAGKHKYVSERLFAAGLESMAGLVKKPWKLFLFFRYIYFNLLLLFYKLFRL